MHRPVGGRRCPRIQGPGTGPCPLDHPWSRQEGWPVFSSPSIPSFQEEDGRSPLPPGSFPGSDAGLDAPCSAGTPSRSPLLTAPQSRPRGFQCVHRSDPRARAPRRDRGRSLPVRAGAQACRVCSACSLGALHAQQRSGCSGAGALSPKPEFLGKRGRGRGTRRAAGHHGWGGGGASRMAGWGGPKGGASRNGMSWGQGIRGWASGANLRSHPTSPCLSDCRCMGPTSSSTPGSPTSRSGQTARSWPLRAGTTVSACFSGGR